MEDDIKVTSKESGLKTGNTQIPRTNSSTLSSQTSNFINNKLFLKHLGKLCKEDLKKENESVCRP